MAILPRGLCVGSFEARSEDDVGGPASASVLTPCAEEEALVLDNGDLLSPVIPSLDKVRGVIGGVAFSRGSAATLEVSLLSSLKDLETLGLSLRDGGVRGARCAGDCGEDAGLEICAAVTGLVMRLDTGRD